MKKALLGGALAFTLFGGAAFANGGMSQKDCPKEGEAGYGTMENCPGYNQGLGGAGDTGAEAYEVSPESDFEDQNLGNDESDPALGGSGDIGSDMDQDISAPSEMNQEPLMTEPAPATEPSTNVFIVEDNQAELEEDKGYDDTGVTVLLGGGVEGYTGDLAPQLNPGPAWGVGVAFKPLSWMGLELGYTGAVNTIEEGVREDVTEEADIVRNGGQALATFGIGNSPVQPYVLGGIAVDRYNVRDAEGEAFRDATDAAVPVGVGLRTHIGDFTADLRGNYGIMFDQDFAVEEGNTSLREIGDETPTGRYGASLRLGATF